MIIFLGLSHLSLCYASSLLKYKKKVAIYDFKKSIKDYQSGKTKIFEPDLENLISKNKKNFQITSNKKIIKSAKIIFLAKDILTDDNNNIKLNYSRKLLKQLNLFSKNKILVIMNQVPVSFTRKINWNKKKLYHFVETLVFGKAVERACFPERLIIGKENKNAKIDHTLKSLLKLYKCPIIELTYEESELTKGFINTYLASQLATTNFLSLVSSYFNARWNKIFSAISLDKRVGSNGYYKPGLGISGGNIERDLNTLKKIRSKFRIKDRFPDQMLSSSEFYKKSIERYIKGKSLNNIGILGFTYKENTLSIKNSVQVNLLNNVKQKFLVHDYKSQELSIQENVKKLGVTFSPLKKILMNSSTLIVFHDLIDYKKIKFERYKNIKTVIDPYGILKGKVDLIKNYYSLS